MYYYIMVIKKKQIIKKIKKRPPRVFKNKNNVPFIKNSDNKKIHLNHKGIQQHDLIKIVVNNMKAPIRRTKRQQKQKLADKPALQKQLLFGQPMIPNIQLQVPHTPYYKNNETKFYELMKDLIKHRDEGKSKDVSITTPVAQTTAIIAPTPTAIIPTTTTTTIITQPTVAVATPTIELSPIVHDTIESEHSFRTPRTQRIKVHSDMPTEIHPSAFRPISSPTSTKSQQPLHKKAIIEEKQRSKSAEPLLPQPLLFDAPIAGYDTSAETSQTLDHLSRHTTHNIEDLSPVNSADINVGESHSRSQSSTSGDTNFWSSIYNSPQPSQQSEISDRAFINDWDNKTSQLKTQSMMTSVKNPLATTPSISENASSTTSPTNIPPYNIFQQPEQKKQPIGLTSLNNPDDNIKTVLDRVEDIENKQAEPKVKQKSVKPDKPTHINQFGVEALRIISNTFLSKKVAHDNRKQADLLQALSEEKITLKKILQKYDTGTATKYTKTNEWRFNNITEKPRIGMGLANGDGLTGQEIVDMVKIKTHHIINVIAVDELYKLVPFVNSETDEFGFVINTDRHDKPGKHWISVFISRIKASVYYYDPLVSEPTDIFLEGLKLIIDKMEPNLYFKLKINRIRYQHVTAPTCGAWSIYFLEQAFNGVPFKEITMVDKSNDEKEGEPMIKKYISKWQYI